MKTNGIVLGVFSIFLSLGNAASIAQQLDVTVTRQDFPVGNDPHCVVSDGSDIWVTNTGDDTVTKLRISDGFVEGTFAVGGAPDGDVFDGANIWVVDYDTNDVTKLRASDGTTIGTFPVGEEPARIAFDGQRLDQQLL